MFKEPGGAMLFQGWYKVKHDLFTQKLKHTS